MANLIYAITQSLDGYIADEDGNFGWSEPSEDAHAFFNDLQGSVGTSLLGRRMYETMRAWDAFDLDDLPNVQRGFAEAWRATDKVVYSSTLNAVAESRTSLERTFDPATIQSLKDHADRDLSIGGAGLAAEAIESNLVDQYLLRVVPIIVGGGAPALPDGAHVDLALNTTHRFDDGSVLVSYSLR